MKRLLIVPIAALALTALVPAAQAGGPTEGTPVECTAEHLTRPATGPCQGADKDPSDNKCKIDVWVEEASCEVTRPTGSSTGFATIKGVASPEHVGAGTFEANVRVRLIDVTDPNNPVVLADISDTKGPWFVTDPSWSFMQAHASGSASAPAGSTILRCEAVGTTRPVMVPDEADVLDFSSHFEPNRLECRIS